MANKNDQTVNINNMDMEGEDVIMRRNAESNRWFKTESTRCPFCNTLNIIHWNSIRGGAFLKKDTCDHYCCVDKTDGYVGTVKYTQYIFIFAGLPSDLKS